MRIKSFLIFFACILFLSFHLLVLGIFFQAILRYSYSFFGILRSGLASTNSCSQKRKGKVDFHHVTKVVNSIKTSAHRQTNIFAYIQFNLVQHIYRLIDETKLEFRASSPHLPILTVQPKGKTILLSLFAAILFYTMFHICKPARFIHAGH